jgi:nucleoside-triphosphatase
MTRASKPFLWTGPQHCGKTTALARLVERVRSMGYRVAGFLAPSLWRDGSLIGFDIVSVATGLRRPLASRTQPTAADVGRYAFNPESLEWGREILGEQTTADADLIVVDEFGPLEVRGSGWRIAVDHLLDAARGVVLLVVRHNMAETVARLYELPQERIVDATEPECAAGAILSALKQR